MKSSEKFKKGMVISVVGGLGMVAGMLLSITIIGACIGVPIMLGSLALSIWGSVIIYQAQMERQQEVIATGVREGIEAAQRKKEADAEGAESLALPEASTKKPEESHFPSLGAFAGDPASNITQDDKAQDLGDVENDSRGDTPAASGNSLQSKGDERVAGEVSNLSEMDEDDRSI